MSGAQLTDGERDDTVCGRCRQCGKTWIGFTRPAFADRADRHAVRDHGGESVQVEEFELLGGES